MYNNTIQQQAQQPMSGVEYKEDKHMSDVSAGGVGLAAGGGALLGALVGNGDLLGGGRRFDRFESDRCDRGVDGAMIGVLAGLMGNHNRGNNDIDSRVDTLAIIQGQHALAMQTANQTNDLTNRTFEQTITLKDDHNRTQRELLESKFALDKSIMQSAFDCERGFARTNSNMDNKFCQLALEQERFRGENTAQHKEILCKISEEGAKRTAELLAFSNAQEIARLNRENSELRERNQDMRTRALIACEGRAGREFTAAQTASIQSKINTALPAAIPAGQDPFANWQLGSGCGCAC